MQRISDTELIAKVQTARDKFVDYLTSLVGTNPSTRLSSSEMNLFNLANIYDDNKVDSGEVSWLKDSANSISDARITDWVLSRKIELARNGKVQLKNTKDNIIDFDHSGPIADTTDAQILFRIMNFQGNPQTALDEALDVAGNPTKMAEFEIKKAAIEFGLEDDTNLNNDDYDKFINHFKGLFSRKENPVSLDDIKILISLYINDFEEGEFTELDKYIPLVQTRTSTDLIKKLHRFRNSEAFNSISQEANVREATFQEYVRVLTTVNDDKKQLIVEALNTNKIPFTKEPLTATNLSKLLLDFATEDSRTKFHIKQLLKTRGISEISDEYKKISDTFFDKFYIRDDKGVTRSDLSYLILLYDKFKIKDPGLSVDEQLSRLTVYANGLKTNNTVSTNDLNALFAFESSSVFDFTNIAEFAGDKIKALDFIRKKLQSTNPVERNLYSQALRTKRLPFINEPLSLSGLYAIQNNLRNEEGTVELQISELAKSRDLRIDDSGAGKEFYDTLLGFYTSQKPPIKAAHLGLLAKLYDHNHIQTMKELEPYAKALAKNIPANVVQNVFKFDTEGNLNLTEPERTPKLNGYFEILLSGSNERRSLLARAFSSNKIPGTDRTLTREGLDDFLTQSRTERDLNTYNLNRMLESKGILATGELGSKLIAFQNTDKLDLKSIQTLLGIYDLGGIQVNDLDYYKDLIKSKVSPKLLSSIHEFQTSQSNTATALEKIKEVFLGSNQEQKKLLASALATKTFPYYTSSSKPFTVSKLNEFIDATASPSLIINYRIDAMLEERNANSSLRTKLYSLQQEGFKIEQISQYLYFHDKAKLDSAKLDTYKDLIKAKVNSKIIQSLFNFETSNRFNVLSSERDRTIESYKNILVNNSFPEQKNFLISALNGSTIPFLENTESTARNINAILPEIENLDKYKEFRIKQMSWRIGIKEGSSNLVNFMDNFYSKFHRIQKLDLEQIQSLVNLYATGDYSYDDPNHYLDEFAKAIKKGISGSNLLKFDKMTKDLNLNAATKLEYLQYLSGSSTDPQKDIKAKFLLQALKTGYVPFTNLQLAA